MSFDELNKAFASGPMPAMLAVLVLAVGALFTMWFKDRSNYTDKLATATQSYADKLEKAKDAQLALITSILKYTERGNLIAEQLVRYLQENEALLSDMQPILDKLLQRKVRPVPTASNPVVPPPGDKPP